MTDPLDPETGKLIEEAQERFFGTFAAMACEACVKRILTDLCREVRKGALAWADAEVVATRKSEARMLRRLEEVNVELAAWPQRYDDSVQPLQRQSHAYLVRAEAAEREVSDLRERLQRVEEEKTAALSDVGAKMILLDVVEEERAELQARLDDVLLKDRCKTREINILVPENRDLRERLATAERERESWRAEAMAEEHETQRIHERKMELWTEAADLRERGAKLAEALRNYAREAGPLCDDGCPADDTCECTAKPFHDAITEALSAWEASR